MDDVATRIARHLASATEVGSGNTIALEEVRGWIVDLLADYAAEAEGQLDRLADLPMWNVMAADADPSHEALFVVALLHGPSATLLMGRAAGAEVRAFGDGEFPEDPRQVIDAARARFPGALAPLVFRRGELLAWLAAAS